MNEFIRIISLLVVLSALAACSINPSTKKNESPLGAGFRYSSYGPKTNPGPDYWLRVGREMADRFPNAHPEAIWIVGVLYGKGTWLSFPGESPDKLIAFGFDDENEAALDLFDKNGVKVWLQVEPGDADMLQLIDLVLDRYGHHPCVIGFGVDLEWHHSSNPDEGEGVTDEEAAQWLAAIRKHNPDYRLFLKHWLAEKMPETLRDGILFVNDSQGFESLDQMVADFSEWGETFSPAPVAFQYGYPADQKWWGNLADPPGDIGNAILAKTPNAQGFYWVDFTVLDVFKP